MCGCGRSGSVRPAASSTRGASTPTQTAAESPRSPQGAPRDPLLEYIGRTSLVVTGPVTGRTYRFERPGAQLRVSVHDAAPLLQALRRAGSPPLRPRT
jgi:hypothetical protein